MKSKLLVILCIVSMTLFFSACAEEEITPQENLSGRDGVALQDNSF